MKEAPLLANFDCKAFLKAVFWGLYSFNLSKFHDVPNPGPFPCLF